MNSKGKCSFMIYSLDGWCGDKEFVKEQLIKKECKVSLETDGPRKNLGTSRMIKNG